MNSFKLTDSQIQEILDSLLEPVGIGVKAKKIATESRNAKLRQLLKGIELNSTEAFQLLKAEIYQRHITAAVDAYSPKGIGTSMATSAPITQSTLNSFHAAGADSGISNQSAYVTDILYASKSLKTLFTRSSLRLDIDNTYPKTMHDVRHYHDIKAIYYNIRGNIEETRVSDVIESINITNLNNNATFINYFNIFKTINPIDKNYNTTYALKVTLNLNRMYSHSVSLENVLSKINFSDLKIGNYIIVPTNTYLATFYVLLEDITSTIVTSIIPSKDIIIHNLNKITKEYFKSDEHLISGIKNVKYMGVQKENIDMLIEKYIINKDEGVHEILVSPLGTKYSGSSIRDLYFICKYDFNRNVDDITIKDKYLVLGNINKLTPTIKTYLNMDYYTHNTLIAKFNTIASDEVRAQVLTYLRNGNFIKGYFKQNPLIKDIRYDKDNYKIILTPSDFVDFDTFDLSKIIKDKAIKPLPKKETNDVIVDKIENESKGLNIEQTLKLQDEVENVLEDIPDTKTKEDHDEYMELYNASLGIIKLSFIGENYLDVLKESGGVTIDQYRTYPSDHNKFAEYFGIDNTCNFLMYTYKHNIPANALRNFELITMFSTNQGKQLPLKFSGGKYNNDLLTSISHERAVTEIYKAAFKGTDNPIASASSTIYVGQLNKQGTGAVRVVQSEYQYVNTDQNFQIAFISKPPIEDLEYVDIDIISFSNVSEKLIVDNIKKQDNIFNVKPIIVSQNVNI